MAQRFSEYARKPDDDYSTPEWVTWAVIPHLKLRRSATILEPAPGAGGMAKVFRAAGFNVIRGSGDFLKRGRSGQRIDAVCTNPPYGGRGNLALRFIEKALDETKPHGIVAMLLKVDFDSGRTRTHVFRDHSAWSLKLVLLDRIRWFEPAIAPPSENHAWFVWRWGHKGPATIAYGSEADAERRSRLA